MRPYYYYNLQSFKNNCPPSVITPTHSSVRYFYWLFHFIFFIFLDFICVFNLCISMNVDQRIPTRLFYNILMMSCLCDFQYRSNALYVALQIPNHHLRSNSSNNLFLNDIPIFKFIIFKLHSSKSFSA